MGGLRVEGLRPRRRLQQFHRVFLLSDRRR
jgi:hypothetical protein